VLDFISKDEFLLTHKTDSKHFTRDRVWDFKTAFLFICSMLNKRVQTEIDEFFAKLFLIPEEIRQVTSSAFTQCRDKIKYSAFANACWSLTEYYYRNFNFKKYYGLRLIAIDGSVFTLPKTKEMIKEFGENVLSESGKWIKAQVSFATDVINNICVDAAIGAYKESEVKLAIGHMSKLGKNNLYIFDRGYFGRLFFREVVHTGCQFCFRVQRNACIEVINFINSNLKDKIGYIDVEGEKLKVRFTKVILDTGEEEYLITSLFDKKLFTVSKLKSLYHLRWGVEEQYKDMKYAICGENFIGKKPNSIKQEFFANILTYNLSMMTCKPLIDKVSNRKDKKNKYKTNKRAVLAKIKQCFVRLLFGLGNVDEILNSIINTVSKESVPIRENRKFARGKTIKAKRKYSRAYVSVV
jgi:hypothetical protein